MLPVHYNNKQLSDLEHSLQKEFLLTNEAGCYSSSTIILCNTRKYHGLLAVPQPLMNSEIYLLLSGLDETIIQGNRKIQFGTHRYPHVFSPEGYLHLEDFSFERIPQWTLKGEDIIVKKEMLLVPNENRLLIGYTVLEANENFQFWVQPLLAFRNIHQLTKANLNANKKSDTIANGIKVKIYDGFTDLTMQFSKQNEFIQSPDWYYNIEFTEEQNRGYEFSEDLYKPGYFKLVLKKGDQIIFSAGTEEINSRKLKGMFESELKKIIPYNDFDLCLNNAAEQFIVKGNKGTEITAGYHWFGRWGRDTFIALPGLTLVTGHPEIFKSVIDTMLPEMKDGLFPNIGSDENSSYNSVDAPLWFVWAMQQYVLFTGDNKLFWKKSYGHKIKSVLKHFRRGTLHNIKMQENGLISCGEIGLALTWMDAVTEGRTVTPRIGMPVEINALWYNAICFALKAARAVNDKKFISEWEELPEKISQSFKQVYWDEHRSYLADCVHADYTDWSLRPNQIIALSLPFSPVDDEIKKQVLKTVENKLLTPRGLRTLSPDDANYKGVYEGNQKNRDDAYHQGTVWVWLLGHFAEAYLKLNGRNGVPFIKELYDGFESAISEKCLYSMAEIFDGDAPHKARGAIAQAWSVAELLRIKYMLGKYENHIENKKEAHPQTLSHVS